VLPVGIGSDPGADRRRAIPLPVPGRDTFVLLVEAVAREEAVAERPVRPVGEERVLTLPARAVGRVERVQVDVPPVRVERDAGRRRLVAVDRFAVVLVTAEEVVEPPAVDPVEIDVELWSRPSPMREVQLPGRLEFGPGPVAEIGQHPLPALERPVAAVRSLTGRHEPGELWAVVRRAVRDLPPEVLAKGGPAAGVVDLELDLVVDRTPGEHVALLASVPEGDVRDASRVYGERDLRGVPRHDHRALRGSTDD
jgi:hypothetical protein